MIEIIAIAVVIGLVWASVSITAEKWGFENWYYSTKWYNSGKALPYCMYCASFWVAVLVAGVTYFYEKDAKLVLVPFMVPAIFSMVWRR